MKPIKKVYAISSKVEDVWNALVDPDVIDKWGGGPSKMNETVGTDFELWNGDIYGKNLEVVKGKKLVQEWYGGDWPKPSIVIFTLKPSEIEVILELEQIDVPDDEFEDINKGWDDFYLGPMKDMLESDS
jgi:activator of HSP90 ATPase